jgi:hypothetical protein
MNCNYWSIWEVDWKYYYWKHVQLLTYSNMYQYHKNLKINVSQVLKCSINKTIAYWFYLIWTVQCIFIWAQSLFCATSVITRKLNCMVEFNLYHLIFLTINALTVDSAAKGAQKTVVTIINIYKKDVDFLTQYFTTFMYSLYLCKSYTLVI